MRKVSLFTLLVGVVIAGTLSAYSLARPGAENQQAEPAAVPPVIDSSDSAPACAGDGSCPCAGEGCGKDCEEDCGCGGHGDGECKCDGDGGDDCDCGGTCKDGCSGGGHPGGCPGSSSCGRHAEGAKSDCGGNCGNGPEKTEPDRGCGRGCCNR